MTADILDQLSGVLADRVTAAAPIVVAIEAGHRHRSGILWRPDVVVTSEQVLSDAQDFSVLRAGTKVGATLAGRDPGTNVAALKLAQPLQGARPADAGAPRVGSLTLLLGADGSGNPTARLAMLHALGPEWHSMAGGRIDALLRLDARLRADEGGPVLASGGALLGMSTAGPRGRTLVIPSATIERVLDPLMKEGRVARGWLGVGLQPVSVPDSLRAQAGREAGMMVVSIASGGPCEQAGVLPGDILLDVGGTPARHPRALAAVLGPDRVGQPVTVRLLRAGALQTLSVTITARPAG